MPVDLTHYIPHGIITMASGALAWFGKRFVNEKAQQFEEMRLTVKEIKENHLVHIEDNTKKTCEILEQMHLDQKEFIGFMKGAK